MTTIDMSDTHADLYNLQRFVNAQESTIDQVRHELAQGEKRSHCMWFIFPQIRGLGSSSMAQRFAIASLEEAIGYLERPLLGSRLRECTALVNAFRSKPIGQIFGYPDDLKFHSCMTLFTQAAVCFGPGNTVFSEALDNFFQGKPDSATMSRLHELR